MHLTSLLAQSDSALAPLVYLAGFLMVLIAITVIWSIRAITAKRLELMTRAAVVAPPAPAPVPAAAVVPATPVTHAARPVEPEGITPEIVALIAAAVATAIGRNHRVVSIKRQSTHWEKAGRTSVLTSHRIR